MTAEAIPEVLPLITSSSHIHPDVLKDCENLYFRQSMMHDYADCGMMALYGWVLSMEQAPPFMAAVLGSAGHKVIFDMHRKRRFDLTPMEILHELDLAFEEQLRLEDKQPVLGAAFDSIQAEKLAKLPAYVEWLEGYQIAEATSLDKFNSTMHEQPFVLEVQDSRFPEEKPYLFTGTIDQAGFNNAGYLVLRDIKFRDNEFKPGRTDFNLNMQMTVYSAALKHGKPACRKCAPRYEDPSGLGYDKRLVYNGPCEECQKKIGTAQWPLQYPLQSILVWMRDFARHEKDQYEMEIINRDLPKVPNPRTGGKGQKVFQRVPNPNYHDGYKAGDFKGQGYLVTNRSPTDIQILMGDILAMCRNMRKGIFFRQPAAHCNFWCKHKDQCVNGIEASIKKSTMSEEAKWLDPFASN